MNGETKEKKKVKKYSYIKKGEPGRVCIFCGRKEGIIRKYGLCICRGCFREKAMLLGFYKYG